MAVACRGLPGSGITFRARPPQRREEPVSRIHELGSGPALDAQALAGWVARVGLDGPTLSGRLASCGQDHHTILHAGIGADPCGFCLRDADGGFP
jgi:hypothetical protein